MTDECLRCFEDIKGKLDRVDEALRGNGKPGLKQRVEAIEQALARGQSRRSRVLLVVLGVLGPIVSGVSTALIIAKVKGA